MTFGLDTFGATFTGSIPSSPEEALGRKLLAGVRLVERSQHPNGEILSFRRDTHGNYVYTRSPFVSSFVHHALACFDPTSPTWEPAGLDLIAAADRAWVETTIRDVRRRICGFLIWQQEAAGHWRFFGRCSGIDPDVNTTVSAGLALADTHGARSIGRRRLVEDAVTAFRSTSGLFYTFMKPGNGGYGWLNEAGYPVVGFDHVVNAEVIRMLIRMEDRQQDALDAIVEFSMRQVSQGDLLSGSPLYPNPMSYLYVLSRSWAEGGLPGQDTVAKAAVDTITTLLASRPQLGPLSAAMAGMALLYLGQTGPLLDEVHRLVLAGLHPDGGWGYEDFVVHGFGSPAWTTALSIDFLIRYAATTGTWIP